MVYLYFPPYFSVLKKKNTHDKTGRESASQESTCRVANKADTKNFSPNMNNMYVVKILVFKLF